MKKLAIFASLLILLSGTAFCAEKVFRFNNGAEPETIDPALMTGSPEITLAEAMFEGLLGYTPGTLDPEPGVAEKWEISEDGLTYTFHLRDAKWSNGQPITAEDFIYSWRRALDPKTAAEYAYQLWYIKNAAAFTKGELKDFEQVGVKAPDPKTIVVTLENPTAFFLELVAFPTYFPVNKACVEKFGNRWTRPENIVTNGPFVMKEWRAQDKIVFERNPKYWDAKTVKLDKIVAYAIVDDNTALRRYQTGELDWLRSLPEVQTAKLKDDPEFHKIVSLGTHFYRLNCKKKPFDDPRVRQAFAMAIDRDRICKFVLHGQWDPAETFVPPMKGYTSPAGLKYDPKKAAALLAEAGYPGGKGFPRVTLVFNTLKRHEQVAIAAQDMWKKTLGVDVNLVNQEWKVYLKTINDLDYDIGRSAWIGDYSDPNTFVDMFVTDGGNNRTGWSNKEYDALVAEAAKTADKAKRLKMLEQAESILLKEAPILPIYFDMNLGLVRKTVLGFKDNARNRHPFKHLDMKVEK